MDSQQISFSQIPPAFLAMLSENNVGGIFDALPEALSAEPPSVAIRLNPARRVGDVIGELASGVVAWEPEGRYLASRPAFTFDPLLHQGAYYVQDPSSMIIGHILRSLRPELPDRSLAYLDACAAPGGKTTAAISALPDGSVVIANEFTPSRVDPLSENLARWGYPYAVVTAGAVDRFTPLRESIDVIAVDAPCSGEGMMRKDPEARRQWTPGLTRACADLQRQILAAAWPALRPGGFLIYSTCTFNPAENEDNLAWLIQTLGAEPVEIAVDPSWGIRGAIRGDYPAMRFIPGLVRGEGLFAAVVRKPGVLPEAIEAPRRRRQKDVNPQASQFLARPDEFDIVTRRDGKTLDIIPASPLLPREIAAACRPVVTLGIIKGRDIIPDQSLALSSALRPDAFLSADVDATTAISFLRHEAITLPEGSPRGLTLLRHDALPLGFVKNLGSRANNLHRPAWRILSPAAPPTRIMNNE